MNKKRIVIINLAALTVIVSILIIVFTQNFLLSILSLVILPSLFFIYVFFKKKLAYSARIKKIEEVFPDFIDLVSSNLRAGMTVDKALLLSSRKEFSPLDEEILKLGKDIVTGKEIESALMNLSKRINSEKINKTINLIVSGLKSGGNLATLLEETAVSMRERTFLEKKASSNVLMYVIFIFFASAIGAPTLFGLSNVLVQVLTKIMSTIPVMDTSAATMSLPFSFSKVSISLTFITYFSIVFIIMTNILASLVLGLISKGDEKAGLKYIIPLLLISLTIFLVVKFFMAGYFSTLLG